MYRVYLDWNVITQIKGEPEGDFAKLSLLLQYFRSRLWIPYSYHHLDDIGRRGFDASDPKKVKFTYRDLHYIGWLTQNACWQEDLSLDKPVPDRRDPIEFFEDMQEQRADSPNSLDSITDAFTNTGIDEVDSLGAVYTSLLNIQPAPFPENSSPFLEEMFPNWKKQGTLGGAMQDFFALINNMNSSPAFSQKLRAEIEKGLPMLHPTKVSSATPDKAFEHIDKLLSDAFGGKSLLNLLNENIDKQKPNGKSPSLWERFFQSYYQLEMFNYHREKLSAKNHFPNIMGDAGHAYLAGYCDFFVTNDNNLRHKAAAVYRQYHIRTRIYTVSEFNEILSRDIFDYTPSSLLEYVKMCTEEGRIINTSSQSESSIKTYYLGFRILDRFNAYEQDESEPNRTTYNFFRLQTDFSDFYLREEFEDMVNTLAFCLGPDDDERSKFDSFEEFRKILDRTWEGRRWSRKDSIYELNYRKSDGLFCFSYTQIRTTLDQQEATGIFSLIKSWINKRQH
jgi:hypothetical protein